ncbi:MAG: transcriptional regulator [Gammaproteobacteria bacterium]
MSTKNINQDTLNFLKNLTGESLSIANLILTIREGEEESQVVFAKKLGITRQRLCDIEHGRSRISPRLAAKFAKKLGYSESQFIRLALQDLLDRDHLNYIVKLNNAA